MSCKFKKLLEKIAEEKAPGPVPTFTLFHLFLAVEALAEKSIGRGKLAEKLSVGEGTARTLIERLRDYGLIEISKSGCALTSEGLRIWQECRSVFEKKVEIEKNELTLAKHNFAILVKNCAHKIKLGVEQRDAAVSAGAKGATTVIFKGGRLIIPSVSNNVVEDFPEAAKQIAQILKPKENDVIIIGSADDLGKAERGTLAAAWTLLDDC
ncbi:MAG: DUF4443 domain-containing protein [Candidatus Bathyarchaeia archaeon]